MTDRELLELAAKAAGYGIGQHRDGYSLTLGGVKWDPLTDDGDAFRLAVHLRFSIEYSEHGLYVFVHEDRHWDRRTSEPVGDDRFAATRRAIVRAAAAIAQAT